MVYVSGSILTLPRIAVILIALLFASEVTKADTVWTIEANGIARVYDGDTFYINLPGMPSVFGEELPIRLINIDTPELRSRCKTVELKDEEKRLGRLATEYLIELLSSADEVQLRNLERGSFFRVVAEVYADGVSVNNHMVEAGHAVAVYDGKSADWCEIIRTR